MKTTRIFITFYLKLFSVQHSYYVGPLYSLHKNIKLNKWLTYVKNEAFIIALVTVLLFYIAFTRQNILWGLISFFLFVVHAFDIRSKNSFTLNVYEVYIF